MVFTFFDDFGLRKNLRKKNCSPSKQPDRRRCIMVVDACDTGRSRVGPSAAAAVKSEIIFGRPSSRRFHLGFRDLYNRDLRGKQWMHAELSGMSLFGANLGGANLFGARLFRTDFQKASLRGAELAFSYAAGANFRGADLRGCSLYRAEIGLRRSRHAFADFTDTLVNEASDIPELKRLANEGCDCWISTSKRSKPRRRTEVSAPRSATNLRYTRPEPRIPAFPLVQVMRTGCRYSA